MSAFSLKNLFARKPSDEGDPSVTEAFSLATPGASTASIEAGSTVQAEPDTIDEESIVDEVEKTVQDSPDRELSTSVIGKIIMKSLKQLDKVAYVRFASVYLEFEDVSEFMTELKYLVRSRDKEAEKKAKVKK